MPIADAPSPAPRSPRALATTIALAIFALDQATKPLVPVRLRSAHPSAARPRALRRVHRGVEPRHLLRPVPAGDRDRPLDPRRGVDPRRRRARRVDAAHAGSLSRRLAGAESSAAALGNAVDRIAYGAVFDFVHLHWGTFSWYVFNVADAAIVAGVAGLLYDSLVLEPRRARRGTPPHESRDDG